MFELNTDRMWFGVGAIILSAILLTGVLDIYPSAMSTWGYNMAGSVRNVKLAEGQDVPVKNGDFSQGGRHWVGKDEGVSFETGSVYLPEGTQVATDISTPKDSTIQVSFLASGSGMVDVGFIDNNGQFTEYRTEQLFGDPYEVTSKIIRTDKDTQYLVFRTRSDSTMLLENVKVKYIGEN